LEKIMVSVEDCLKRVPNRFDLSLIASMRARQISLGSVPRIEDAKGKPTVIALEEIAQGAVTKEWIEAEEKRLEELAKAQLLVQPPEPEEE
jgi:DNA-directed RNA polymerase subunit omega